MEPQKFSICYTSSIQSDTSPEEVQRILDNSTIQNINANISGILLHNEGNFMQVIEGEEVIVTHLFQKIKKDDRHHAVQIIYQDIIPYALFEGYRSGFTEIMTTQAYEDCYSYLDLLESIDLNTKVTPILRAFLDTALQRQKTSI